MSLARRRCDAVVGSGDHCRCVYVLKLATPWCPRCGSLPWFLWRVGDVLIEHVGAGTYHLQAQLHARTTCQRCGVPLPPAATAQHVRHCPDCWLSPFDDGETKPRFEGLSL